MNLLSRTTVIGAAFASALGITLPAQSQQAPSERNAKAISDIENAALAPIFKSCVSRLSVPETYSELSFSGNTPYAVLDAKGGVEQRYNFSYQIPGMEDSQQQIKKTKDGLEFTISSHRAYFDPINGNLFLVVDLRNVSDKTVTIKIPPERTGDKETEMSIKPDEGVRANKKIAYKSLKDPERKLSSDIQLCYMQAFLGHSVP